MTGEPWYQEGLRFECTRCGHCCSGGPGTVRVTEADVATLAAHLQRPTEEIRSVYTRRIGDDEISLKEKSNHDCIFYDQTAGCTVYSSRPRQCRTWPFWRAVVQSPETWTKEAKHCPGMDQGRLYSQRAIRHMILNDGTFGRM